MLITSHICKTMDIGVNDNLFGGRMMAWLDEAGVIFAQYETGKKNFVTKSFDKIEFKRPVKVGDTVYINAEIFEERSKGVSVKLEAICAAEVVCETIGVFIHVDEKGIPAKIYDEIIRNVPEKTFYYPYDI